MKNQGCRSMMINIDYRLIIDSPIISIKICPITNNYALDNNVLERKIYYYANDIMPLLSKA